MKLTNEILKQMIMEELERLDEFKVTVNPSPKINPLASSLGISKSDLYSAAVAGGKGGNSRGAKAAAKSLAALGGASPNDIDDGDFAAAKAARSSKPKDYDFANQLQQKSSNNAFKADWAGSTRRSSAAFTVFTDSQISNMNLRDTKKNIKKALAELGKSSPDASAQSQLGKLMTRLPLAYKSGKVTKKVLGDSWYQQAMAKIGGTNAVTPAMADDLLQTIDAGLKAFETQDITRPELTTVGAESGQQDPYLIASFNSLMETAGANTMAKRIEVLNEISDAMVEGNTNDINKFFGASGVDSKREFLNAVVCMDYITKFTKEIDDRAGAYFFESFCALISGGKMDGGAGLSGDFVIATKGSTPGAGSSKYVGGNTSSQAVVGFTKNKPVLYIYAKKVGGSRPEKTALALFVFSITITKQDIAKANNNAAKYEGPLTGIAFKQKGNRAHIHFTVDDNKPTHMLYLSKAPNKSFKESLEDMVADQQKTSADKKLAFEKMSEYYSQTRAADNGIKAYLADGKLADGTRALQQLAQADESMVDFLEMFKGLSGARGKVVGTKPTTRKLTENENNLDKVLDKLIKEVILNK